ncbi:MAG TPA: hypothetical protein VN748_03785 [Pseudonocardiaceae bacterium]|nr:hypothetical protein [Pseudonocardiaceae bacterium]
MTALVTHNTGPADEIRRAFTTGAVLNLAGAEVPGALLAGLLAATPRRTEGDIPALRLAGAVVRGSLELPGATVTALVELTDCTFDGPIDLYAAQLAGWRLMRCTLPRVQAPNVQVRSELALENCTITGPIVLPDARIEGPLRLIGTSLHNPGGHALVGVRLAVRGVLDARRLRVAGEVRLSGARVDGNIDLRGAQLSRPGGDALEASGVQIGGNLRCDRGLTSQGRLVLAGASVAGNAVFSGAALQGTTTPDDPAVLVLPRGSADPSAALLADRLRVNGNLVLDAGFTAVGTVRLTNARVGGHLRLSGATLGSPVEPGPDDGERPRPVPVALAADGIEVLGDLEARRSLPRTDQSAAAGPLSAHGQVRLVGAQVHGSVSLTGVQLDAPGLDVLFADRLQVGGTLYLCYAEASGSIRLHHANIGSTLDCTGAQLTAPRRRPDGSIKASLDARAATIGKDLYASRGFRALGGVRISLAEVSKSVNFSNARLGGPGKDVAALRARGLRCQELKLGFAEPPHGDVSLACVVAGSVVDDKHLWATRGKVDIEDFEYQSLTAAPEVTVATRLHWVRDVLPDYDPDPYDQLARSYRDGGHDDLADTVLLAKQRHRHSGHGPAGRFWGWLQEWTVGYGYRPWRAACWLAVCWLFGSVWFVNHRLVRLDSGQNPSWQPVIYTADLLVPVVNLGQDGLWRTSGASAWVASALTAVGWLLLSTGAAGATRILTRR